MFCKSCGHQIDSDSLFCSFCGEKQSAKNKPTSETSHEKSETNIQNGNAIFFRQQENLNTNFAKILIPSKFDLTYKKEEDAIFAGVILLIFAIVFAMFGSPIKFEDREKYGIFVAFFMIFSLIFRIWITVWVVGIAKRQNRETYGWAFFAFLAPSLALIISATRKKLALTRGTL